MPFLYPNKRIIKIQMMFLIENENIVIFPSADAAIAIIKLAPTTSSIEKAFFIPYLLITWIELTKIL